MALKDLELYRASTSEADLQTAITDAVDRLGGRWAHVRDSRGQQAEGLPDLIIAAPWIATVLFLECKGQTGRVRPKQVPWLENLGACSRVVTTLVRPIATIDAVGQDDVLAWLEGTAAP